jgi:RimJ/RimL family protein N-acetyltransferase
VDQWTAHLLREICAPDVSEFVPPPPTTIEGVQRTIRRGVEWRTLGRGFFFGIQVGSDQGLIGLLQFLASRDAAVSVSTHMAWEWGFGIGTRYWGRGLFREASDIALDFAFKLVALQALDAWGLQQNQRANAAMARLGAEATFHPDGRSPDGRVGDFVKWTIRRDTWMSR